ncbi:hypothetical protein [Chryseobacterium oryctis]|uniref:DUF4064 domain-containing protein n=1 Tax=Chryseobacterium oryctis TaxID=2952618 RepID=A0ABT3HPY1_9FLAO|nr:hypothetical protein [Chryseobacterium oryctis]MCW3161683.1 hypothetical protein [Chryseobacterium oryctis]
MLRNILAVLGGIFSGSICVWLMESLGHYLYPLPKGMKPNDIEAFKDYIANAPFMALFFVILSYGVAAFVAGFVASKITKNGKHTAAIVCGIIFLFFTVYNMVVLPTPVWFWVLGIVVWGLVLIGSKLAINKKN